MLLMRATSGRVYVVWGCMALMAEICRIGRQGIQEAQVELAEGLGEKRQD
jgi:hypothetical protein